MEAVRTRLENAHIRTTLGEQHEVSQYTRVGHVQVVTGEHAQRRVAVGDRVHQGIKDQRQPAVRDESHGDVDLRGVMDLFFQFGQEGVFVAACGEIVSHAPSGLSQDGVEPALIGTAGTAVAADPAFQGIWFGHPIQHGLQTGLVQVREMPPGGLPILSTVLE